MHLYRTLKKPPNRLFCESGLVSSLHQAAISACDWQHALMLLEKMQYLLMQPQTITCSSAITSCGLQGRWEEALHLFESLEHPDLIALNALISACEKGAAWQAALDLTFVTLPSSLRANLITYNSALSACEKSGQWQQALAILAQLSDKDAISYNACISACGGVSQWQPALLLMSEVQSQGLADVVTCAASVDACSQAGLWQQVAWTKVNTSRIRTLLDVASIKKSQRS